MNFNNTDLDERGECPQSHILGMKRETKEEKIEVKYM